MLRKIVKVVVGLGVVGLLGYLGYLGYLSYTNTPFNVRITNVTGRSVSITWLTDRPSSGKVLFSDSVDMGLINYQAAKAYDDRDVQMAFQDLVDSIDLSQDDVTLPDLTDIEVRKVGRYYVHHVTIDGLEPESEYFFKLKNGVRSWSESQVGISTAHNDVGVISDFMFTTAQELESISEPSPAYGTILSLQKNADGEYEERETDDGLVFYRIERAEDGFESEFLSAVTNVSGGWTVDRSNARTGDGELMEVQLGEDLGIIFANVENYPQDYQILTVTGENDAPTINILGSSDESVSYEIESVTSEQSLVSKVSAQDKSEFCDGGCHNGWTWKMIGQRDVAECKKAKRCDSGGESVSTSGSTSGGLPVNALGCVPGIMKYETPSTVNCRSNDCVEYKNIPAISNADCVAGNFEGGPKESSIDYSQSATVCCEVKESFYVNRPATIGCEAFKYGEVPQKLCGVAATVSQESDESLAPGLQSPFEEGDSSTEKPTSGDSGSETFLCPPSSTKNAGKMVSSSSSCCSTGQKCDSTGIWTGGCKSEEGYQLKAYGGYSGCYKVTGSSAQSAKSEYQTCKEDGGVWLSSHGYQACKYSCGYDAPPGAFLSKQDAPGQCCPDGYICSDEKGEWDGKTCENGYELAENKGLIVRWGEKCVKKGAPTTNNGASIPDVKGLREIIGTIKAQESESTEIEYLFPETGLYQIEAFGETMTVNGVGGEEVLFYFERNGVNGYQNPVDPENPTEEEDLIIDSGTQGVTVSKKATNKEITIKEGINIVSFPYFLVDNNIERLSATEMLEYYEFLESISFFENGRWREGVIRSGSEIKGRDFALVPGRGYVLVSGQDATAVLAAKVLSTPVPLSLSNGWNLIGVHGYTQPYTAKTLIESVNELEGVTSDNVTYWPTSKGRYEGLQISEGTEYGFDFPIQDDLGYFLRVIENGAGSVIWGPGTTLHGIN
jgi:hypothetical protein